MRNEDVAENLKAILGNEKNEADKLTRAEKLANRFANFAGTVSFGVAHIVWFTVWIGFNLTPWAFDKYPFNFLTMVVSLEAIFLSITLLIAQNFLSKTQERRAALDLQINLLAEKEDTVTLKLLVRMAEKMGVEFKNGEEKRLLETTSASELLEQIAEAEDTDPTQG